MFSVTSSRYWCVSNVLFNSVERSSHKCTLPLALFIMTMGAACYIGNCGWTMWLLLEDWIAREMKRHSWIKQDILLDSIIQMCSPSTGEFHTVGFELLWSKWDRGGNTQIILIEMRTRYNIFFLFFFLNIYFILLFFYICRGELFVVHFL